MKVVQSKVSSAKTRQNNIKKKLGVTSHPASRPIPARFKRSQNWAELWTEFYTSIRPSGSYVFKTVRKFAEHVTANVDNQDFLAWYIGPRDGSGTDPDKAKDWQEEFGFPQDWQDKRNTGGWFTQENMQELSVSITKRFNALDALRETGNQFTLHNVGRAAKLMEQLDREFHGRFFLDELDAKQNQQRALFYIELHNQLVNYQQKAFKLYAMSHGLNFDDARALTDLLAGAMQSQANANGAAMPAQQQSAVSSMSERLSQMALSKMAAYGLNMPNDMAKEIIDVQVEPVISNKKKVQ